jgi:26S proteasome regulatory subunit T5
MFEGNMKQYKLESNKITHDMKKVDESLKDNRTKIKQNKQLPWLVSNVVEILDIEPEVDDDGQVDVD